MASRKDEMQKENNLRHIAGLLKANVVVPIDIATMSADAVAQWAKQNETLRNKILSIGMEATGLNKVEFETELAAYSAEKKARNSNRGRKPKESKE